MSMVVGGFLVDGGGVAGGDRGRRRMSASRQWLPGDVAVTATIPMLDGLCSGATSAAQTSGEKPSSSS